MTEQEKSLELQKYEADKRYEIQQKKLDEASNIVVGNSNLTAISMMAEKFAKAGDLIPKEFQGQPEKCFVAIYKGASLGLDAFTSLQRIAVVNGRATIWGDTALALVRNSGLLAKFKEELIEQNGKLVARCIVQRRGEDEHIGEFSQDDAINAGLWGNNVWKKYPKRMLKYRARAYALRDIFADVLDGLYLKEELEGDNNFKDVTPKQSEGLNISDLKGKTIEAEQVQQNNSSDSVSKTNLEEEKIEEVITDNSEVIETAFKKVSDHLQSMKSEKAINMIFDYSCKNEVELLRANKPDYYAELVELKKRKLEEVK